jgi:hypothetical protein
VSRSACLLQSEWHLQAQDTRKKPAVLRERLAFSFPPAFA